jgi:peptide/nickel transport system substrate-binding protein
MTRKMIIGRRQFLKSGAAGLALAALSPSLILPAMAEEPTRGGTLKLGFSADPAGFDPARGPSGMSHVVIEQIYSTLMSLDPDAVPYPDLAEKYEQSADGLEYTFHLRKGVKFHDGLDLTAEDVKFTFDRLRAKDTGYSYGSQVETIKEVVVVDPHTVTFKLTQTTGPFLVYMAFPGSSIVPKKLVEGGHDLNAKPVGSGPFKFVSYEPRSMVKFTRNEGFYEAGKPYVDALEFHLIADITALTNAVISGNINFSNEIPPKDWQTVSATPGLVGLTLEGSRYYWLLMNNTVAPLDNRRCAQAIAHAIDRSAIVAGVLLRPGGAVQGRRHPRMELGLRRHRLFHAGGKIPEKAKALLAEAGHADGFATSITMASSFPAMVAMAPIIQANLAAIGIKAEIKTMEIPRYWDEVWGPSKFDMTSMYWVSPLADPDDFVTNNYACGMAINVQKSCSKAMDEALAKAKSAPTQEARKAAYAEQQKNCRSRKCRSCRWSIRSSSPRIPTSSRTTSRCAPASSRP